MRPFIVFELPFPFIAQSFIREKSWIEKLRKYNSEVFLRFCCFSEVFFLFLLFYYTIRYKMYLAFALIFRVNAEFDSSKRKRGKHQTEICVWFAHKLRVFFIIIRQSCSTDLDSNELNLERVFNEVLECDRLIIFRLCICDGAYSCASCCKWLFFFASLLSKLLWRLTDQGIKLLHLTLNNGKYRWNRNIECNMHLRECCFFSPYFSRSNQF